VGEDGGKEENRGKSGYEVAERVIGRETMDCSTGDGGSVKRMRM
jgi:hypothetical protein